MFRFILYLFETGICLSLLYLAYWLFLRKETYFSFNRIFLVGSIVLALSVPLLHLNFSIRQGGSLEDPASGIVKFRTYYEEMISMIDADFGSEPGPRHSTARGGNGLPGVEAEGSRLSEVIAADKFIATGNPGAANTGTKTGKGVSPARIALIIYIIGVMYFLIRFIYLVVRLYLLAWRNGVTRQQGFRMVEIQDDIAPFSFFRFLFINSGIFNDSERQNVLEHEKAHIRHRHSLDHLIAHGLAVFQWFNPVAWQMRKALKTTHEYIADRQVIEGGFELFDYQSLLLKQVIGYHSVELVNNFNLKPIKNRIAMMTKKRSGLPARLKAMLVIPFTITVFLLFADFTLKGPGNSMLDLQSVLAEEKVQRDMTGLWVKQTENDFSSLLHFTEDRFSFSEGTGISKSFFWRFEQDALVLSDRKGADGINMKAGIDGNELVIWWNNSSSSRYLKSDADNSMDLYLSKQGMKIDLPDISRFRLMEKQSLVYKLCLGYSENGKPALNFNGMKTDLSELEDLIDKERSRHSLIDVKSLTAMLFIDAKTPMSEVDRVKQELRRINSLKIADAGYPHGPDHGISPLLFHTVGLPRILPPADAVYMDKEEIRKDGIRVLTIDLAERNTTPAEVDRKLEDFIRENAGGKYFFSLEYDEEIPYGQYIEVVDMVFRVVYRFRDELAMERHNVRYLELGDALQKEIRKAYPMVLSEALNRP